MMQLVRMPLKLLHARLTIYTILHDQNYTSSIKAFYHLVCPPSVAKTPCTRCGMLSTTRLISSLVTVFHSSKTATDSGQGSVPTTSPIQR